jgi:hypothetical protein
MWPWSRFTYALLDLQPARVFYHQQLQSLLTKTTIHLDNNYNAIKTPPMKTLSPLL